MAIPKYSLARLRNMVLEGESDHLEFKEKANSPGKILHELVAFANANGGVLLLGVKDSGKVVGVRHPEAEEELLKGMIGIRVKPDLKFTTYLVPVEPDRAVVVLEVPEGRRKPYYSLGQGPERGTAFLRIGDESVKMGPITREVLERKKRKAKTLLTFGESQKQLLAQLKTGPKTFDELKQGQQVSGRVLRRNLILLTSLTLIEIEQIANLERFSLSKEDAN